MSPEAAAKKPSGVATATYYSSYTFHYHLRIAAFEGFIIGLFLLNEFVARKTLKVSDLEITLMMMLPMVSFMLPLFWKPHYRRGRVFLWIGIPGRTALFLLLLCKDSYCFIPTIILASLTANLLIPVQNDIIKINYGDLKGYYFGRATTVSALTAISTMVTAGWLLQWDESLYRLLYPAAGLVGIVSFLNWSRIRKRSVESRRPPPDRRESEWTFSDVLKTLREHHEFRDFQINFFIYGTGFMMLALALPLYLVDRMQIQYTQASIARGLIFYAILVFFAPLAGIWYDRLGPYRLTCIGYSILALFSLAVLQASSFTGIYVSFALFGVAMTCINTVWNLGPVQIAPAGRERFYMSFHMALVGLRACFAFPIGILIKTFISFEALFLLVFLLEVLAAIRMFLLHRNTSRAMVTTES